MFIEMRAVLDVGGSCADGGPYVQRPALSAGHVAHVPGDLRRLRLGRPRVLGRAPASAGATARSRSSPGRPSSARSGSTSSSTAWRRPGGGGIELGFLIPGILFELMGGIPLRARPRSSGRAPVVGQRRRAERPAGGRPAPERTALADRDPIASRDVAGRRRRGGRPPDVATGSARALRPARAGPWASLRHDLDRRDGAGRHRAGPDAATPACAGSRSLGRRRRAGQGRYRPRDRGLEAGDRRTIALLLGASHHLQLGSGG